MCNVNKIKIQKKVSHTFWRIYLVSCLLFYCLNPKILVAWSCEMREYYKSQSVIRPGSYCTSEPAHPNERLVSLVVYGKYCCLCRLWWSDYTVNKCKPKESWLVCHNNKPTSCTQQSCYCLLTRQWINNKQEINCLWQMRMSAYCLLLVNNIDTLYNQFSFTSNVKSKNTCRSRIDMGKGYIWQ